LAETENVVPEALATLPETKLRPTQAQLNDIMAKFM
jgi:hypothetical protein